MKKTKKILITFLLILTIINVIYPSFAYAATETRLEMFYSTAENDRQLNPADLQNQIGVDGVEVINCKLAGKKLFTARVDFEGWILHGIDKAGKGLYGLINNIFCDSEHKFRYYIGDELRPEIENANLTPETIIKRKISYF